MFEHGKSSGEITLSLMCGRQQQLRRNIIRPALHQIGKEISCRLGIPAAQI
ncbi:MAG: hypothetical protein HC814_03625 [Rhodobacteraceae bacterium]|nr:hypothetical protein [Paracoccaceae bacterium]